MDRYKRSNLSKVIKELIRPKAAGPSDLLTEVDLDFNVAIN